MKRAAGFTLIELVIVIVILGILGAVAAPRFINLQDDAYKANVNGLRGSIQSAATLANTKAVLGGWDKNSTAKKEDVDGTEVEFKLGYPTATKDGILAMLQNTDAFSASDETDYNFDASGTTILIYPRGRSSEKVTCNVKYTEAVAATVDNDGAVTASAKPAKIEATVTGC